MSEALYVVPCFNEEQRLPIQEMISLAREPGMRLVFVDDGSQDGTREKLEQIRLASEGQASWIALAQQSGKAEAVRQGLLHALEHFPGVEWVGYLDADLSTPWTEALRLVAEARRGGATVIMGARVVLLGRKIVRSPARQLLGRTFAALASSAVGLRVYDTQCGAKVLRAGTALRAALARPFLSRWAFDVELIGRLLYGGPEVPGLDPSEFREVPLFEWADVPGSKLRLRHMARAGMDLVRIAKSLSAQRRAPRPPRPLHVPAAPPVLPEELPPSPRSRVA